MAKEKVNSLFWGTVLESLVSKDALMQLHRCTCKRLVLDYGTAIDKAKQSWQTSKMDGCWCRQAFETSHSFIANDLAEKSERIIQAIRDNNSLRNLMKDAQDILPLDSPLNFGYNHIQFQFGLIESNYQQASPSRKAKLTDYHAYRALMPLFKTATRGNKQEILKLAQDYQQNRKKYIQQLNHGYNKAQEAIELFNTFAYSKLTGGYVPQRIDDLEERQIRACLEGYNSYYESFELLRSLYSLVRVANGLPFVSEPFKGASVNLGSKNVIIKGSHQKWPMIKKIIEDSPTKALKVYLSLLYDRDLRNSTSHNDYYINVAKQRVETSNGKSYTFVVIRRNFERMRSFANIFTLLIQNTGLQLYEIELAHQGFRGTGTGQLTESGASFLAFQFLANAVIDPDGHTFKSINLKWNEEQQGVSFSFPDSLKYSPTQLLPLSKDLLDILRDAKSRKSLTIMRIIISPRFPVLYNPNIGIVALGSQKYYSMGIWPVKVSVKPQQIDKILKTLEGRTIPDGPSAQLIENMYRKVDY